MIDARLAALKPGRHTLRALVEGAEEEVCAEEVQFDVAEQLEQGLATGAGEGVGTYGVDWTRAGYATRS
jgi:hypothetical protein